MKPLPSPEVSFVVSRVFNLCCLLCMYLTFEGGRILCPPVKELELSPIIIILFKLF
jgi:hypothetical protein